jgi:hypothetical protein
MVFAVSFLFAAKVFDELEQHAELDGFPDEWGKWWNKSTSWVNKHNWGVDKHPLVAKSLKTWLVWITDAEHFFQMLKHWCMTLAFISFAGWQILILFLAIMAASALMNEYVLIKFFNKNKKKK